MAGRTSSSAWISFPLFQDTRTTWLIEVTAPRLRLPSGVILRRRLPLSRLPSWRSAACKRPPSACHYVTSDIDKPDHGGELCRGTWCSTSPPTTSCPRRRRSIRGTWPGSRSTATAGPPAGRHVRRPAGRGFDGGVRIREAAEEFVRDDPFVNEGAGLDLDAAGVGRGRKRDLSGSRSRLHSRLPADLSEATCHAGRLQSTVCRGRRLKDTIEGWPRQVGSAEGLCSDLSPRALGIGGRHVDGAAATADLFPGLDIGPACRRRYRGGSRRHFAHVGWTRIGCVVRAPEFSFGHAHGRARRARERRQPVGRHGPATELSRRGLAVVLMDYRGYGETWAARARTGSPRMPCTLH